MTRMTFAIITDIHSNIVSLRKALSIIRERENIDQIICLGDCFPLGPAPRETLKALQSIKNCVFIRGNHDRYIIERLWTLTHPCLEGMDPDDPLCKDIVANIEWTAKQIGAAGNTFLKKMHVAHRVQVKNTIIEFTHAWYQRDDMPPTLEEALNWRRHVKAARPNIDNFIFVHGHIHTPRFEKQDDLTILCQGATGLSFDGDTRGAVAFLTVGNTFEWDVIRYTYDYTATIKELEKRKPPFYENLMRTVRYAEIRNDL